MKILIVTSEYGEKGGGLSFACTRLNDILGSKLGHDVTVVSSCDNTIQTAKGGYNPTLSTKISSEYRLKTHLQKFLENRYELIIAFGGSFNGYYANILAKRLRLPLYLMLRGTDINMAKWDCQESFYLREAGLYASRIICLSSEMVSNVLELLPSVSNICSVIPNAIEPISSKINLPVHTEKLVIGCTASHINEKKGIANLLYVVEAFKDISNINMTLHVIGDIDNDLLHNYQKIAKELSISDNVIFDKYMSRQDCIAIQKTWNYYIQGSVCEGFCNSVGECISAGIPVFISNTGFISEILKDRFPQFVFDSFEPRKIASQLNDLINLANKENMYNQAYSLIYEKCDIPTVTNMWKQLLSEKKEYTRPSKRQGSILTVALHEILGSEHDPITTPESVFIDFIERINNNGYGICSFKDYLKKPTNEKDKWIVCTFDDGYASLVEIVLPILNQKGFTATVFVNSDLIGKDNSWNWKDTQRRKHLNEDGIKKLFDSGWEIGAHGHTHRNLLQLTEKELDYEFSQSSQILSSLVGIVSTYAYPYGASSPFVRKICNKYYDYGFALHEGGTELSVDKMMIRRYSLDDIYKILSL